LDADEAQEAWWHTLLGNVPGHNSEQFPPDPLRGLLAFRRRLQENTQSIPIDDTAMPTEELRTASPVLAYMGKFWRNRVFFSTAGGRVGYATKGVKERDKIFVLSGEPQLYVLRLKGELLYEFVAVAFVHGLMSGEGCGDFHLIAIS